jgi:HEAT repeat protein
MPERRKTTVVALLAFQRGKDGTVNESLPQPKQMEQALRGLTKLIKAVQYYPPAHPTLKAAIAETRQNFAPLLGKERPVTVTVRKEGFFLSDQPVGSQNPVLAKLALFLFARRIQTLLFLPDLSGEDLRTFARCLTLEPKEVVRMGGIKEVMRRYRIATIWANELDMDRILAQRREVEEEKRAHAGDQEPEENREGQGAEHEQLAAEERSLAGLVKELLEEDVDQRYRYLLQELVPLIQLHLNETDRPLILDALSLVADNARNPRLSKARREYSLHAMSQLTTDSVLDFLVEILCHPTTGGDEQGEEKRIRERIMGILLSLQGKTVVWRLMDHLAQESNARVRKILSDTLVRQGKAAVPVLLEHLEDKPWFVVRNAVAILGEIRDQEAAPHLRHLLDHKDVRVRRETIRALTKIGGQSAVGILLQTVEDGDQDLRKQALLSLGAMKNTAAVPTLLRIVETTDPMMKQAEVKREAIKALGEIGSAEAVPILTAILGRRKFWRRTIYNELRTAAAQALGDIGALPAVSHLEKATDDRSPDVARAAFQALKQMKRGDDDGS